MARTDDYYDPFAFDFARNQAELGGGFAIYDTDISLQGGLQLNADYTPTFFNQSVVPLLKSSSPWGWILLGLGLLVMVNLFQSK